MLLVLDNCEHVVDACRQLVEYLLPACPELTVLATSREVLGLIGEHVRQVPPLSLPDPQQVAAPELLVQSEGIRLFVERAGAASPGFALTPDNAWVVAQICQRLDGIPLALELAAARVRFLSVETIVARLDDRFHLLTSGKSAVLARHQTLRSTVDWSYDLLSEPERIVFRQLGVFVGGFTLQAAEAVAAVDAIGVAERVAQRPIIALLAQLADKSLLVAEQQGKVMRYRLLETMRAYTQEKLMTAGEMDIARDKLLAFFVQMAEEAEPHLFGADQMLWLDRLEADHENLRAAMDWALERMNADAALRMVAALRSFWFTRGHYSQGRAVTLQALALPSAQQRTPLRAKALNAAGALMWTLGDGDTALPLLEEALLLSQELDDRENLAWAKLHIGTIAYQQNNYVVARRLLETGLAIGRQLGPIGRRGVGWAQIFLGDMALQEGDQAQAQTRYAEAVTLLRELSDNALLAYPLRRLGQLTTQRGNFHEATTLCKESLSVNQAIGDQMGVAASLAGLVAVAAAEGFAQGGLRSTEHLRYAALLAGAVAGLQEQINASLLPADASTFERSVAAVQAQIGEVSFALAWAEGHAMSLEQVLQVGDKLEQTSMTTNGAAPPSVPVEPEGAHK
jgi:non-specific serine/threonine protein kinase